MGQPAHETLIESFTRTHTPMASPSGAIWGSSDACACSRADESPMMHCAHTAVTADNAAAEPRRSVTRPTLRLPTEG